MTQMTHKTFNFHSDPGHGWLEVSIDDLQQLNVIDQISSCSYLSPDCKTVYLEEDCDYQIFAQVYNDKFDQNLMIKELEQDDDIFIRHLNPFYTLAIGGSHANNN